MVRIHAQGLSTGESSILSVRGKPRAWCRVVSTVLTIGHFAFIINPFCWVFRRIFRRKKFCFIERLGE